MIRTFLAVRNHCTYTPLVNITDHHLDPWNTPTKTTNVLKLASGSWTELLNITWNLENSCYCHLQMGGQKIHSYLKSPNVALNTISLQPVPLSCGTSTGLNVFPEESKLGMIRKHIWEWLETMVENRNVQKKSWKHENYWETHKPYTSGNTFRHHFGGDHTVKWKVILRGHKKADWRTWNWWIDEDVSHQLQKTQGSSGWSFLSFGVEQIDNFTTFGFGQRHRESFRLLSVMLRKTYRNRPNIVSHFVSHSAIYQIQYILAAECFLLVHVGPKDDTCTQEAGGSNQ